MLHRRIAAAPKVWVLALVAIPAACDLLPGQSAGRRAAAKAARAEASRPAPDKAGTDATTRRTKAMAEYRARAAAIQPDDVVRHFALAEFCARHGLAQALRWQLHVVLRLAPDHVGARTMRGEVFHDGRWVPARSAGRVLVEGRWLKPHAADQVRQRREAALRRTHRKNLLLAALGSSVLAERRRAAAELRELARGTDDENLRREIARRLAAPLRIPSAPRRRAAPSAAPSFGLIGIRATRTELLGLPIATIGLAAGVPLRLQLPQTRTISFGTTVLVPLSPGR